jgi:NAD/NADP transhydrogenase alpha subunit
VSEENETTVKAILAAAEKRAVAAGATAQQGRQMAQLQAVATFLGFNELAKLATSLGERVYYRMCRETAKEHAELMGAELGYDDNAPGERIVMVLPGLTTVPQSRKIRL